MDKNFVDILKKIAANHGRETLINAGKCKPFLADYTKREYQKESNLFLLAIDAGVAQAIDKINKMDEIALCKQQQFRRLQEEYSIAATAAADVVETLALVLKGDTTKIISTPSTPTLPIPPKPSPVVPPTSPPPVAPQDWPQYSMFDGIGRMVFENKEYPYGSSIYVEMIIGYDLNDAKAKAELTARIIELRDFVRYFFGTKSKKESKSTNELQLKQDILEHLNTMILNPH